MAEEPTPPTPAPDAGPNPPANSADSPAGGSAAPAESPSSNPPADGSAPPPSNGPDPLDTPLPDGTSPTVLKPGGTDHATDNTLKKGRAKLTSIYQKADILTTLVTFIGAAVTAGIILGAYAYFTRSQNIPVPKSTKLEQADLSKIQSFFQGNSAGTPAEILTVVSSTFFKNRVAFASDVKVVGGTQITGPTALGDLTVDKTSTLGITNIRGQLTVSGPTTLQSPATLSGGATVGNNLTVTGNGSFGGALSAGTVNTRDLSLSGTLNLAGHLAITGQTPSVAPASDAGSGATANVDGNDSGGTITLNTGSLNPVTLPNGGLLVTLTFKTPYGKVPHIVITPVGATSGALSVYVQKTATTFTIGTTTAPRADASYAFDYWVVQ